MKLYSWNVNGIRAVYRKGFLNWIKKANPDILCLQETKARAEDFPEEILDLNDYYFYSNSAQKRGYAGTAILSKLKPKKVITKIGVKKFDNEGRFLLLDYGKFKVFNTYFPHSQRELNRMEFKLEFNKAYLNFVKKLDSQFVILTGDFNYAHTEKDLANPKENQKNAGFTPDERKMGDSLEKLGWVDTYRYMNPDKIQYTWWSYRLHLRDRDIGWRIDYFFIKQKYLKKVKSAQIHDNIFGSDHCPISLELT